MNIKASPSRESKNRFLQEREMESFLLVRVEWWLEVEIQ